jgi:hypothetical protein
VLLRWTLFVRWKRRQRTRSRQPIGQWVKAAVLVESISTPSGRRLRHVCYLGSIWEGHETRSWLQVRFWESAQRNLARLAISKRERQRIESLLQTVVPKPDKTKPHPDRTTLDQRERSTGPELQRRPWLAR